MERLLVRKNSGIFWLFLIVLSIGLRNNVRCQEAVKIKRVTGDVVLDGIPGEAAWESLDLFPLVMHKPMYGILPSEKSEVRIGYDDEFLWVGASLYMADASRIFAVTKKRDEMLFDYDAFGIILDTYDDKDRKSVV